MDALVRIHKRCRDLTVVLNGVPEAGEGDDGDNGSREDAQTLRPNQEMGQIRLQP